MSSRAQRTLLAVGVPLAVLIMAVLFLTLIPKLDPQIYAALVGLALIAGRALSKWIEDSTTTTAAPTVAAVTAAIVENAATVPPPSIHVQDPAPTLPAA